MKRNYTFKFLSIICVLSFVLSLCNSGIDLSNIFDSSIKINESLVLPIGKANLTTNNIFEVKMGIYVKGSFTNILGTSK